MSADDLGTCPYCGELMNAGVACCRACGRRVREAKRCPFCGEPVPQDALRCYHCSSWLTEKSLARLKSQTTSPVQEVHRKIVASPIGAFLHTLSLTAILYPPEMEVSHDQMRLRRWTLFGLRVFDQKISTRKVASVRFHKGIIWASITLETHGGAMSDLVIPALDVSEAQESVALIESILQGREHEVDDENLF